MIDRIFLSDLLGRMSFYPGVVLLGARQVGKSTLARQVAAQTSGAVFLDLELPADRAKLDNPIAFFAAHRDQLVVIDEVQKHQMPRLYEWVSPL